LAAELLGGPGLAGTRIAVLGATFKPQSDDVRDAPALAVAAAFARAGAAVRVYDPEGMDNARHAQPDLAYAESLTDAVTDASLVLVATEWAEFRNADPEVLGGLVAERKVIDGRNCLDRARWTRAGWAYRGMGR
jgi:UDPglucose 6-dehydrogenase